MSLGSGVTLGSHARRNPPVEARSAQAGQGEAG
jgi:hypothetical protein